MARERRHRSRPRRRRGRFGFLYRLLSVLLVTAAIIVACVVFFRVNRVEVVGNSRYTAQEIIDASGIRNGDNLIALSKSGIAARIRVGLPYVYSVAINRVFPDGVLLTVEEHVAAAAVSDGSGWWYISAQGKLLEQAAVPGRCLTLNGLTAVEPELGGRLMVAEELQPRKEYVLSLLSVLEEREMLGDCTALDCTETGVLWLDYLNFRIKMPTTGDFDYIMHTLDQIFDEDGRVSRTDSGVFDFTITEGKAYYSPSG